MSAESRPSIVRSQRNRTGVRPRATQFQSWLGLGLVTLLLAEVVAIAMYCAWRVRYESDPVRLADRAQSILIRQYPELRHRILRQVDALVPNLAIEASNRLVRSTATARQELEAFTVQQLELGIDNAVELSADEFRQWLRDNHDAIEDAFRQIEQAPLDAKLLVLDTEASVEEQLGLDVRDQARLALDVYRTLNDKLERLSNEQSDLSEQERLERRTIRLVRALTNP